MVPGNKGVSRGSKTDLGISKILIEDTKSENLVYLKALNLNSNKVRVGVVIRKVLVLITTLRLMR